MSVMLVLYIAIFAAALAALVARSRLASHLLLGLAGGFGLIYGLSQHGPFATILPFLILIVAAVQTASLIAANRAARFTAEEDAMLAGPLAGLGRAQARRLLDQGMWMHGRAGDVLTREGDPVGALTWLASGAAEVIAHGAEVGAVGPGQLVGEATILSIDPATATVRLTEDSHFWCAPAKALTAYLAAQPRTRAALERGFSISLKDKLKQMNRRRAR